MGLIFAKWAIQKNPVVLAATHIKWENKNNLLMLSNFQSCFSSVNYFWCIYVYNFLLTNKSLSRFPKEKQKPLIDNIIALKGFFNIR